MSRNYPFAFYNVDNNRNPDTVERELRAILTNWRPAILGVCETGGLGDLWGVEDYIRIRDTSKPGRDNVAAYVKTNLDVRDIKWHDLKETWTKTNPGATGQHWPRSILEFRAGRLHVLVAHQPPKGTDNVKASQQEGIDKLTSRMGPWTRDDWDDRDDADKAEAQAQARLVLWDANRNRNESGPGPKMLGEQIDGYTAGGRIDCCTYRGGEVTGCQDIAYPTTAGGVPLKSDHGAAFRCTLLLVDG